MKKSLKHQKMDYYNVRKDKTIIEKNLLTYLEHLLMCRLDDF